MPLVTFVGSLCKIHAVLYSKIADVHGIEVHDVRTRKFVYFRKIFRFLLHNTRDVTRRERGQNSPGAESLRVVRGRRKSQQGHKHFLKYSTFASERLRFEHGGAKLVSCSRRHLTSLRPCTSRLSSQNVEICLQKYLPIRGRLSIINYLKKNAVDYRSHLTIENDLKVEKNVYYIENKHNFPPPQKNAWGTRRGEEFSERGPNLLNCVQQFQIMSSTFFQGGENFSKGLHPPCTPLVTDLDNRGDNIPKKSKAIIMLALCSGRCLLHHKGIEKYQTIFFHVTAGNVKFAMSQ